MCEQGGHTARLTVDVRLLETFSWSEVEISCHLRHKEEEEEEEEAEGQTRRIQSIQFKNNMDVHKY